MHYEVLLLTNTGAVYVLLTRKQLEQIDQEVKGRGNRTVIIKLGTGRRVEAHQVLCRYNVRA